jgi:hypothetical protein
MATFLGARRIIHPDHKHETIELCLRQRIRALLLDWILRRQHEERRVEREVRPATVTRCSCIASSIAACVFGRRPVDLIGQHDVGEHRPLANSERRLPPGSSCKMSVPVMSIGIRSGVN